VVVPRPRTAVTDDLPVGLGVRVGFRRQLGDARAVPVVIRGRRVAVLVDDTVGVDPQVRLAGVALDLDVVTRHDLDPNERVAALDRRGQCVGLGHDRHDLAAKVARLGGVCERSRGRSHDDDDDHGRNGQRQPPSHS
jgi:hypothetical protein